MNPAQHRLFALITTGKNGDHSEQEAFETTTTHMEFIPAALDALKVQPVMTLRHFVNFVGRGRRDDGKGDHGQKLEIH